MIGRPVTMSTIREFRDCVDICDLQELKSPRAYFTWNNKKKRENRVYSRIDRVLINME